ncbi:hypothetical protein ACGFZS_42455 [Streptomyces sp. NPDC048288]|uniref:hypothetical protein n=1 Tax=Streptomyces sp. NPDC048288 TaxID=3365529 RepID=UPI0037125E4E
MPAAVEDKAIVVTPCKRITLPSMPDEEFTPLTVAQVEAMLGAMPPYVRTVIVVLAGSGSRIGELLGLTLSGVDFRSGTIRVERRRRQSGPIGPPRTGRSRRTALKHGDPRPTSLLRLSRHHAAEVRPLWPGEEDRTRTVMDAVLGGLRTGCGPENPATKEIAGQTA